MARACLCGRPALEGQASCTKHLRKRQALGCPSAYGKEYTDARLVLMEQWIRNKLTACHICGAPARAGDPWEPDHVIPVAQGGTAEIRNLRPAHRSCNRRRGARMRKVTA